ncbi:hypothetical protein WG947_16655 [Pontibacter sp. H259]|uniref:hypothetical protein n=1 Tax=Pontibacter sp. H259 TaxID=3133421 RepID=UPI0030BE00ED
MKKQFIMLACLAILASSCGNDNTQTQETAAPDQVETTTETDTTTVPADSTAIENATTEIEEASVTVDSLLSEI